MTAPLSKRALLEAKRAIRESLGAKPKGVLPQIVSLVCPICQGAFTRAKGEYERKGGKYCSIVCMGKASRRQAPPYEELRDLYVVKRISANSLADIYGVSDVTLRRWLDDYGIPVRTMGQAVTIATTGLVRKSPPDRAELHDLYITKLTSIKSLSVSYGVGRDLIRKWLEGFSIPIRPQEVATSLTHSGKPKSQEHCAKISATHIAKGSWAGKLHPVFLYPEKWAKGRRAKTGKREDLGGLFVRSSWEANICRYLIWLQKMGQIARWEYEPDCFEFKTVKRGNRFYTPDFKVFERDGQFSYWEVKGWMDPDSKTKLDRMARHYPEVKIVLIEKAAYMEIKRKMFGLLEGWE